MCGFRRSVARSTSRVDRPALSRALEPALARNVTPAVYTEDMFRTTHDAANREAVRAVIRAAMRVERKVIYKIVDGCRGNNQP